jgi:hypothetical protein
MAPRRSLVPYEDPIESGRGAPSSTGPLDPTNESSGASNLNFVIPSELRISYYAALTNGPVCGFL